MGRPGGGVRRYPMLAGLVAAAFAGACASGPGVRTDPPPAPLGEALGGEAVRGPLRVLLDPLTGAIPVTPPSSVIDDPVAWLPKALAGYEYYLVHDAESDPPVLIVRVVGRCEKGPSDPVDFSAALPEIRAAVLKEALAPLSPTPEVSRGAAVRYGGCLPTVDPNDIPIVPPGPDGAPAPTPSDLDRNPEPLRDLSTTEMVPPGHGE